VRVALSLGLGTTGLLLVAAAAYGAPTRILRASVMSARATRTRLGKESRAASPTPLKLYAALGQPVRHMER
jgi:hypothetical protein